MGLEGLELLMNVENEFRIHFTDAEAIKIFTIGDLRDAGSGLV
jgi:acyl carrier protein